MTEPEVMDFEQLMAGIKQQPMHKLPAVLRVTLEQCVIRRVYKSLAGLLRSVMLTLLAECRQHQAYTEEVADAVENAQETTEDGGEVPSPAQEVRVPIVDQSKCQEGGTAPRRDQAEA